jgi:hypothetical protein
MTAVYVVAGQVDFDGFGQPEAVFSSFETLVAAYPMFNVPGAREALEDPARSQWSYRHKRGGASTTEAFRLEVDKVRA